MPLRCSTPDARSAGAPAVAAHQRGIEPGLINEYQTGRIEGRLRLLPDIALQAHVRARLLGRYPRFF